MHCKQANQVHDGMTEMGLFFKISCFCIIFLAFSAETESDQRHTTVFNFETDEVDKMPEGFSIALTGNGPIANWLVRQTNAHASGDQVVAQLSTDKTNRRYPILIHNNINARNIDLSVKFKTISGEVDASGGLIFRYKDSGNYYVVRANSLENNVVAYKTQAGKRSNIGINGRHNSYGVDTDVPHQKWNSLRVVVRGDLFEIYLNKRKLFEVTDDVFKEAGKIGLWTKADAVTQFDELRVEVLDSN